MWCLHAQQPESAFETLDAQQSGNLGFKVFYYQTFIEFKENPSM